MGICESGIGEKWNKTDWLIFRINHNLHGFMVCIEFSTYGIDANSFSWCLYTNCLWRCQNIIGNFSYLFYSCFGHLIPERARQLRKYLACFLRSHEFELGAAEWKWVYMHVWLNLCSLTRNTRFETRFYVRMRGSLYGVSLNTGYRNLDIVFSGRENPLYSLWFER